ncbi:MAG: hypothetical protein HC852_15875 [Acaryochloridaceae cyanobacterium RU_4_10]|nr:hypothetical protein [Acaryochloridaceae cyanobacterium RU_4_10]
MKPAFQDMSIDQLRTYVLEHREDTRAFKNLVDRLKTDGSGVVYPCPNTPEIIEVARTAIQERLAQKKAK